MDFTVQQQRLSQLAGRLNLMVMLVLGLLLSNFLIGGLAWYTSLHQKVEVTPFSGTSGYHNSALSIDTHYLSMMTENFLYSRLNVTPETVRLSHKRLLSFADVAYYPKLLEALNKEARIVSTKKISSYFEMKDMQFDEKKLTCKVTGTLKRAMGTRAFHEEHAAYTLQYQYHLGRLSLTQFTRLEQPEAASIKGAGHVSKKRG